MPSPGSADATGEVRIDGVSPDRLGAGEAAAPPFIPSRVAGRRLAARRPGPGQRSGCRESQADEAMADLDLTHFAARRVDRLSTGERSRVLIARALAPRPRLLLLDEPVANLDPLWQLRLMERLREAVAGGQGAIVAMHDLDLAGRYADRLILMESGRIAAEGEPNAVLASARLEEAFGIRREGGMWRPLSPREDPRSSR